jgi:hypothetical protein
MIDVGIGAHPEFDELSALADLDEAGEARTPAGRHVLRCAVCRAEVTAIRALGDAARGWRVEVAGPELWERIRLAASDEASVHTDVEKRPPAIEAQHDSSTTARSTPRSPLVSRALTRRLVAAAGIIVAFVAVALWPSRASLDATGTSRLAFTPGRPVPGGIMTVRYRPARWFRSAPRLVLAGRFVKPDFVSWPGDFVGARDGLDSLAVLQRTADGSFQARVRLPDDFLGVRMAVFDTVGVMSDQDGSDLWVAIGGTRDGAPSLASFIAGYTSPRRREQSRQGVSVADSIQRYFPGHPAGWSLYDRFGTSKGILDLFRFFATAERKYASLDATLSPRRGLDAEQMWAMLSLASKISEPAEEAKWAQRLAREHPEDPRSFKAIAAMVHGIELRDPPHVGDSVARWMPVLDSLYLRSRPTLDASSNDLTLLRRRDNAAWKAGWSERFVKPTPYFTRGAFPAIADAKAESEVRRILADGCAKPAGKFPLPDLAAWTQWCTFDHQLLWQYLADSHLAHGEAAVARALADSAIALGAGQCSDRMALRTRGDVRLALADTLGAARDYAVDYGRWKQQGENRSRAVARLGPRFDAASFDALADSTWRETMACLRRRKAADSAHEALYGNP